MIFFLKYKFYFTFHFVNDKSGVVNVEDLYEPGSEVTDLITIEFSLDTNPAISASMSHFWYFSRIIDRLSFLLFYELQHHIFINLSINTTRIIYMGILTNSKITELVSTLRHMIIGIKIIFMTVTIIFVIKSEYSLSRNETHTE